MKKTLLTSLAVVMAAANANAAGLYVSPKLSWNTLVADETRAEKKFDGKQWSDFADARSESWHDKDGRINPKFAVGYDFDAEKYGVFGVELEYGQSEHRFDIADALVDFEGETPNDSGDVRHMTYSDSTIMLNAKYGYDICGVTPYVFAGIGYTTIDSENSFRSGTYWWDTRATQHNFAWNIGAGVEVPVAKNIALTIAYNYTSLGTVDYSNWLGHEKAGANGVEAHFDSSVDLVKHELTTGLKIMF